jgi:hypothetical protein
MRLPLTLVNQLWWDRHDDRSERSNRLRGVINANHL